ncbi:hypothetical protein G6F57_022461 [Rhizopus arrhizus]|nr:hypothetical protein G6F57_022461 [Rhizopus arrhizus]
MPQVTRLVTPGRRQDEFSGQDGRESVISRNVAIGHRRLEECQLQVAHFVPVHDMRVQGDAQALDDVLDVVDSQFRVPAAVEVHRQWA